MPNPFEFINTCNGYEKKNLIKESDDPTATEKEYQPFIVNRGLSLFADTCLYANEMNMAAHIDKLPQYEYLLYSIRPKKRWSKWPKSLEDADLELVRQAYNYSAEKARAALKILSNSQLDELRKSQYQDHGGVSK